MIFCQMVTIGTFFTVLDFEGFLPPSIIMGALDALFKFIVFVLAGAITLDTGIIEVVKA